MIICMQCGSQNRKEDKKCTSCGAMLPRFEMTPTVKVEVVTGRFKRFHDTVEGVRQGNISAEDFSAFLQSEYDALHNFRDDVSGTIEGTDYMETAADEMHQGLQGLMHYEEGIHELWAFLEDGEVDHLDAGIDMIRIGNDCINDAMRINRVNRRKLEDEWGTM